jgi:hypothetical protein
VGPGVRRLAGPLLPVVRGRAAQYLLQRPRLPRRPRAGKAACPRPRQPRHPHRAHLHLRRAARRGGALCRGAPPARHRAGRPGHRLHADGAGSDHRDARLRAHRGHPLRRVRGVRAPGAGRANRRRTAAADPLRFVRHRGEPRGGLQAAPGPGDRDVSPPPGALRDPAAAAGEGRSAGRPRPRLARRGGARRFRRVRARRCHRPAVHPLHLGHHGSAQGRGPR